MYGLDTAGVVVPHGVGRHFPNTSIYCYIFHTIVVSEYCISTDGKLKTAQLFPIVVCLYMYMYVAFANNLHTNQDPSRLKL